MTQKKLLLLNQLMEPTQQLIWTHLGYSMNKILDKIYYIDFFDTMEEIIWNNSKWTKHIVL